jgi:hypothetical protein
MGLVMRGSVVRRRRRQVGGTQIEVVPYTLGPRLAEFEVWRPTRYLQIGEAVEVEGIPHLYNNRVTFQVPQEETF